MAERSLPLLGQSEDRALRIHDLVKAPENTPESIERRTSWDATRPATVYDTPEVLSDGRSTTALTVILRTKGCHWWWSSGCTFCGYFNDTREDVTNEDLHAQWGMAMERMERTEGVGMLKVYTSGSLLEDREIPLDFQATVLRTAVDRDLELVIESRTEQLTPEKLAWATSINPSFTVAIGLEAHDDEVLRFHVNKGFTVASWQRAVGNLRDAGLRVKTYLMFKPPFMSEGDALRCAAAWVRDVAPLSDEVSVNPMNIQRGTVIDRLHRYQEYRPPWLWSLMDLILDVHDTLTEYDCRMIVHPTAAGKVRGAHNCGACDAEVASAIERYAVSTDLAEFEGLACTCRDQHRAELNLDAAAPAPLGLGLRRRGSIIERLHAP